MNERDGIAELGRGAWRRLRRSIASDLQRTPLYRQLALRARAPESLAGRLRDLRPGDPEAGALMLDGRFFHGGETLNVGPDGNPWTETPPSEAFRQWMYGFSWLRDLMAANPNDAPERARLLVDQWLEAFGKWDRSAWTPTATASRVYFWLADAPTLFRDDDPATAERLDTLARHAKHLEHVISLPLDGRDALSTAIALAAAGACLPDGARMLDIGLERVAIEVQRQILPDGGHITRSPEAAVDTLADLYALDDAVHARGWETPNAIRRAIDRLAPMVRFFLLSDGGLSSFHGGGEGDRGLIEALLACDDAGGRTFEFAPHSGYHRVNVNGATLMFDVGDPPPGAFGIDAHASCLSFEFAPPGGRLIVNCGWSADQPVRFREPVRATAAHSTLVLEDTSSMRLIQPGLKRDLLGARLSSGSGRVTARRSEEEQGIWIEGSQEGYRAEFGMVHRRRIYISNAGGDVRGEDTLFRPVEDAAKDAAKGLARDLATNLAGDSDADAEGSYSYAIRFHLAPGVKPDVARDQRSALLILPSGESWRFRTDAGTIEVEPSIYLATSSRPRETRQLILRGVAQLNGALDRPPNRVRWALQKLGRAPSA